MLPLPIDNHLAEIVAKLGSHQNLIISAPPGTGKTTRVPQALLRSNLLSPDKKILILTPRRLAAKLAAMRVADETQTRLGEEIGYQFRFESVQSAKTRILFITEGLLTRFLISDPLLRNVGLIIIDEFHERHLAGDIAIAKIKALQNSSRSDLKMIVMSATLSFTQLTNYLDNVETHTVTTPIYPLTIKYLSYPERERTEEQVLQTIKRSDRENCDGDILVFLSGQAEIQRCCEHLERHLNADNLILKLFAALTRDEQNLVFEPATKRKIILATNIAESSLTINGVRVVIDTGTHREPHFAELTGIPTLLTKPVSRASAIQRAGRAARQAPGLCLRLYSEHDFITRREFDKPEILRSDLSQTLLELIESGTTDFTNFPWFENPSADSLNQALRLLIDLEAIASDSNLDHTKITPIGKKMAALPMHPRLARFLIAAQEADCLHEALVIAAEIAESDFASANCLDSLSHHKLSPNTRRISQQMADYFKKETPQPRKKPLLSAQVTEKLAQCLLTAFPDRVGKRKLPDKRPDLWEITLCRGGTGQIKASAFAVNTSYFIALGARQNKIQGKKSGALVIDAACPISADELLEGKLAGDETNLVWNDEKKSVTARWQLAYGQLILSESTETPRPGPEVAKLVVEKGLGYDLTATAHHSLTAFFAQVHHKMDLSFLEADCARYMLLKNYFPEWNLPDINASQFDLFITTVFGDVTSLADLKPELVSEKFWQLVPQGKHHEISRLVPEQIRLTEKRSARIHYELGKEPWMESFLQDFYAYRGKTKILGERLSITLHLLAPNRRPVQVTRDLEGFFKNTYPELKNQLARRYPRHKWP